MDPNHVFYLIEDRLSAIEAALIIAMCLSLSIMACLVGMVDHRLDRINKTLIELVRALKEQGKK